MVFSVCCVVAENKSSSTSDKQSSWTGVWQSLRYNETLVQNGSSVTGTYVPFMPSVNDTGILNGTISDNESVVNGVWSESGEITLTRNDDNFTLDVLWAYDDQSEQFKKSEGVDTLYGTWNSPNLTLSLQVDGSTASGVYRSLSPITNVGGYLNGTVSQDGKKVTGTFVEAGNFTFALAKDGSYFNGTYSYGSEPVKEDDTWNAIRLS
nr:hypothetical protein [uncultured Methanospirillum sp.]